MRYEKILFAIQDLELPFPVTYRQIGFFFTSFAAMFLISRLPGLGFMKSAWLIYYIAIPGAITWFLTRFKLDGKSPHRYIWDLFLFKQSAGTYNRYEKTDKAEIYKYNTVITYRHKGDEQE